MHALGMAVAAALAAATGAWAAGPGPLPAAWRPQGAVRLAECRPYEICKGFYRGRSGNSVRFLDTHRQVWRPVPVERQSRIDEKAAEASNDGRDRPNLQLTVPRFSGGLDVP